MLSLEIKSALLCACWASATFAPMLVPERRSCLERVYSFFVLRRYLHRFTVRIANWKLFCSMILSITFNFPLSIFNCTETFKKITALKHIHPRLTYSITKKNRCQREKRSCVPCLHNITAKNVPIFVHLFLTLTRCAGKIDSVWCTLPQQRFMITRHLPRFACTPHGVFCHISRRFWRTLAN